MTPAPVLRRAVRLAGRDRQHRAGKPGQRERDRPVRAEALPVPVVRLDPALRRLRRPASPACSTRQHGLYHDLQTESTTPAFSWISPNNCSDAHDAVCHGNNLSGGFSDPNTPNPPLNYTGGLYASDLFLEHIIPEIEASPAFKDGGLIDVTFDEAFPPFTYTGNSFANSTIVPPNAATSIASDSAGETLFGRSVRFEPAGPNTPLKKGASGQELYPGPGDNAYVDRPANCVAQTVPSSRGHLPARRRQRRAGRAHRRGRARRGRCPDDRGQLGRRDRHRPHGDRHRHPGRRVRRKGDRHRGQATPPNPTGVVDTGRSPWSTRGRPAGHDRRGQRRHARRPYGGD